MSSVPNLRFCPRPSALRRIGHHLLIGVLIGLLAFLPNGIEALYAQELPKDRPQGDAADRLPEQEPVPAFVRRLRNLKFWHLKFQPSYRQEVTFDDNVFLNDTNEGRGREWDIYVTERPGITTSLNYKKVNVTLSYVGEVRQYLRHPELNTKGFAGDAKLDIDLGFDYDLFKAQKERGRFFITVTDDIFGRTEPIDLATPTLVARIQNVFKLRTGYQLKSGEVYLEYGNSYLKVFRSEFKRVDNFTHTLRLGAKYRITPRLDAELFVIPGFIDFEERTLSDQQFIEARGRLRGQMSENLIATLELGYRHQEVVKRGTVGDDSSFDGLVGLASVQWDVSPRTKVFASVSRDVLLSSISNFKEATIGRISVSHELIPRRLLGKLKLEVNHQVTSGKLPEGGSRPVNTRYMAGLEFEYKFRSWIDFDLSYTYKQNDSNQDNGNFLQNTVTAGVSFKF